MALGVFIAIALPLTLITCGIAWLKWKKGKAEAEAIKDQIGPLRRMTDSGMISKEPGLASEAYENLPKKWRNLLCFRRSSLERMDSWIQCFLLM